MKRVVLLPGAGVRQSRQTDAERIEEARRSARTAVAILTAHPPEEVLVPVTRNVAHYRFVAAEFR